LKIAEACSCLSGHVPSPHQNGERVRERGDFAGKWEEDRDVPRLHSSNINPLNIFSSPS
jgi:hypothetical protein